MGLKFNIKKRCDLKISAERKYIAVLDTPDICVCLGLVLSTMGFLEHFHRKQLTTTATSQHYEISESESNSARTFMCCFLSLGASFNVLSIWS